MGCPKHSQKGFLRQFLGLCGIVHAAPEKSVNPLAVAQEEFGEGFLRALLKFQDQLLIAGHRSSRARIRAFPERRVLRFSASVSVMSGERKKFPSLQFFSGEAGRIRKMRDPGPPNYRLIPIQLFDRVKSSESKNHDS